VFVSHVKNVESLELKFPGVSKAHKKSLIGPREGWEGWVMRTFTLKDGGFSPRHSHPWPHINYVLGGRGTLYLDGKEHEIEEGSIAYIPSGADHQFLGRAGEELTFICIVPEEGDK